MGNEILCLCNDDCVSKFLFWSSQNCINIWSMYRDLNYAFSHSLHLSFQFHSCWGIPDCLTLPPVLCSVNESLVLGIALPISALLMELENITEIHLFTWNGLMLIPELFWYSSLKWPFLSYPSLFSPLSETIKLKYKTSHFSFLSFSSACSVLANWACYHTAKKEVLVGPSVCALLLLNPGIWMRSSLWNIPLSLSLLHPPGVEVFSVQQQSSQTL